MGRPLQSSADYAAIAVAPLLIFLMLSSLAGFLMVVLYDGPYILRVCWVILMYTMGSVAVALITIEENRGYASMYAGALGLATLMVMTQFVGSPLFSAFLVFVIGFLADRIVHDCTIIDDRVDSSGRGLLDGITGNRVGKRGHQPGRTVLYLAIGALPLFGIGQFFLSTNPTRMAQARWLLLLYLFSALSLLVVTAFLNLRRYLRQRGTDMPHTTTLAWLIGGMGMIAMVVGIAYVAPLPGRLLASVDLPEFLTPKPQSASRYGWGSEGAKPKDGGAATTSETQREQEGAPESQSSGAAKKGAPPGGSQGNREDGPAGQQSGGKQSGGQQTDRQDSGDQKGSTESANQESNGEQSSRSGNKQSQSERQGDQTKPSGSEAENEPSQSDSREGSQTDAPEPTQRGDNADGADKDRGKLPDSTEETESSQQDETPSKQQSDTPENQSQPSKPSQDSSSNTSSTPTPPRSPPFQLPTGLASLLRIFLFLALIGVVLFGFYVNRRALMEWWRGLFDRERSSKSPATETAMVDPSEPPRPFASFRNPVGKSADREAVVITFQALEAWCREQGTERRGDETPSEFVRRVAKDFPELADPAIRVVDAYNRIVYGRGAAVRSDVDAAAGVWKGLAG
ncbi:MAG: DUF4129 domain-containing protein [Planctomycetota bacterium]